MPLRVLYVAEMVSKPGLFTFKIMLPELKKKYSPDLVMLNADSCTGGYGLGRNHAMQLRKMGAEIITGGDQLYYKKDMAAGMDQLYHVLRPANYPAGNPGRGWKVHMLSENKEKKVGIISMMGQPGFNRVHLNNPFTYLPELVKRMRAETPWILMDFHSVTTAEKVAMGFHADGLVSAVLGSGLKTQTADSTILPKGTGFISDCGRTGSLLSVDGFDPGPEITQFLNGVPQRSSDWWEGLEIQGCFVELDDEGRTVVMEPFRLPCTVVPTEQQKGLEEKSVEEE